MMPNITFIRLPESLSPRTVGTDSLNVMREVPGVLQSQIVEEYEERAVLSYVWDGQAPRFDQIDELAYRFGLRRDI